MYAAFSNMQVATRTRTNVKFYLDDPTKRDGQFTNYISALLDGYMDVVTRPQALTVWNDVGPLYVLPWHVLDMPSEGESSVGTIRMNGNPNMLTTGVITQNVAGQAFPGTLQASVFNVIEIPGYGKLHNKFPVVVEGTADSIPPFHTEAACRCALLFDEQDNVRGMVGGRSLTILGPA